MIDAACASASRIRRYSIFGYARQDRKDKPRVAITSLVANMLVAAGAHRVLAMNPAQQIQGFSFRSITFLPRPFLSVFDKNIDTSI